MWGSQNLKTHGGVMRKISSIIAIGLSFTLSTYHYAYACDLEGKTGIVPENTMFIPTGLKALGGISQAQFNRTIDGIAKIYTPVVKSLGGTLTMVKKWEDGTVNAYAHRDEATGKIWHVSMFGGLARHPSITEDAFAMVVCHELGHHLGGAPRKSDALGAIRWASNEGQADYYAALKCMRKYLQKDRNYEVIKKFKVPIAISKKCNSIYPNVEESAICIRTTMAGLALADFFKNLGGGKTPLSVSTPNKIVVKKIDDNHPEAQCRLDTYFQGSICDKSLSEDVSADDVHAGTCTKKNGDNAGLRPRCWFVEV